MNVASAVSFVWDTKPDFPSAVRLKMSFVEDWTPLKAIQALIPCKIGKQGIIER